MRSLLSAMTVGMALTAAGADIPLPPEPGRWRTIRHEGAAGDLEAAGGGELRIVKRNAEGILEFRSRTPVRLTGPARWFMRGEFQSERNPAGTLFFFRLVPTADGPADMFASGSQTLPTETLLVNAPKGRWLERIYSIKFAGTQDYWPTLIVIGNPAEFKVRGLHLTQRERLRRVPEYPGGAPYHTRKEVETILAARPDSTAEVRRDEHGELRLCLNGRPVTPAAYKNEGQARYEYMFRDEDFFRAGIPLLMINVPLCHDLSRNQIVLGPGRYDWKRLDEICLRALRRNPHADFMLAVSIYEPYLGWAAAHPDEIWRNAEGKAGLGNNCHLKFFSNTPEREKFPEKVCFWMSYSSEKWQVEYCRILTDVLKHVMSRPYGKAVVGVAVFGGDDGQFQYRRDDHSLPAQQAFRRFLREKYSDIAALNRAWRSDHPSFDAIVIPTLKANSPPETPFLGPGPAQDFRRSQYRESWRLRERFSGAIKAAAGKPVVTAFYGLPDAFSPAGIELAPSLDIMVQPCCYPARRNMYPYPCHPWKSFKIHGKLWFNELDLRSWRSRVSGELADRWMNPSVDPASWRSTHRKTLGPSFAERLGWWYFSLPYQGGRFFDAPEIMAEIRKTGELYREMQALPYRKFRPDVCVVADESSNYCIETQPYASYGNPNGPGNGNGLNAALEISGVPYDKVLLRDILARPEYQNYKVYVFYHNAEITSAQRRKIASLLKNRGRTLVWVYSSGYIDEHGKNAAGLRELTGFDVTTREEFSRQRVYSRPEHPLNAGRREAMSYGDMELCLQMPFGLKNIWGSPFQIFSPVGLRPEEVVAEDAAGTPAAGFRRFAGWDSLYLAAPHSLTSELMQSLARRTGCYRAGNAGHNLAMNGNFVSIHPLFDDRYEFFTPPGVTEVLDADTGKVIGRAPKVTLELVSGVTRWLFMR